MVEKWRKYCEIGGIKRKAPPMKEEVPINCLVERRRSNLHQWDVMQRL